MNSCGGVIAPNYGKQGLLLPIIEYTIYILLMQFSIASIFVLLSCLATAAEFQNMFLLFFRVVFLLGIIYSFASSVSLPNNAQDVLVKKKKRRRKPREFIFFPAMIAQPLRKSP